MIIGYCRTSTTDQKAGLEAQQRDLQAAQCERIFVEEVSSVDIAKRKQLDETLLFAREGDTLVVTKLDRLARSVAHLLSIVSVLDTKKVTLRVLDTALDTSTPSGKLMLGILGSIAQFEREIMLERQREGIAKAKADGKYKGRKPTARNQLEEVRRLLIDEKLPADEVAKRLSIGRSSIYRILKDAKS
jgi:DNA invertase Pin-like site-specific DNA recombinase